MFGLNTRTTAALEAYNGHLGRRIFAHANFFVLCTALIEEEFLKSVEFDLAIRSANAPTQRREYRQRDDFIKKLSSNLKDKQISVDEFLNGIIFNGNNVSKNQCQFDDADVSDDSCSDFDPVDSNEASTSQQSQGIVSGKTCVVCLDAPSDVLLNCGHYNYCLACFDTQKALHDQKKDQYFLGLIDTEPKLQCPLCKTEITQHLHVKNIFY